MKYKANPAIGKVNIAKVVGVPDDSFATLSGIATKLTAAISITVANPQNRNDMASPAF
jgi:hypothetical protein